MKKKQRRCTVCKYKEYNFTPVAKFKDYLYKGDKAIQIHLCTDCSVSLFKRGQKNFLLSHYDILLKDFISFNDPEFISLLQSYISMNKEEVKFVRPSGFSQSL